MLTRRSLLGWLSALIAFTSRREAQPLADGAEGPFTSSVDGPFVPVTDIPEPSPWCEPCREKGNYHFITFMEGGVVFHWPCFG